MDIVISEKFLMVIQSEFYHITQLNIKQNGFGKNKTGDFQKA